MTTVCQTWLATGIGVIVSFLLIVGGCWWFKIEEKVGDRRDTQSSLLALRSASRLIISGIVLMILSFIHLWTMSVFLKIP